MASQHRFASARAAFTQSTHQVPSDYSVCAIPLRTIAIAHSPLSSARRHRPRAETPVDSDSDTMPELEDEDDRAPIRCNAHPPLSTPVRSHTTPRAPGAPRARRFRASADGATATASPARIRRINSRPANCHVGITVPKDTDNVPMRPPVSFEGETPAPVLCIATDDDIVLSRGLERLMPEPALYDVQLLNGLRLREVIFVISEATGPSDNPAGAVNITQRGLQLIGTREESAWPLRESPGFFVGGNWWQPTFYTRESPLMQDIFTRADGGRFFGPVLTSTPKGLEKVLQNLALFDVRQAINHEHAEGHDRLRRRAERPRLVDSRELRKLAEKLEYITRKMEEQQQTVLCSAPSSIDATRLAAAASNFAQALYTRERLALLESAQERCFICIQNDEPQPRPKQVLHFKFRNDPKPCNSVCMDCQSTTKHCLVCKGKGGHLVMP